MSSNSRGLSAPHLATLPKLCKRSRKSWRMEPRRPCLFHSQNIPLTSCASIAPIGDHTDITLAQRKSCVASTRPWDWGVLGEAKQRCLITFFICLTKTTTISSAILWAVLCLIEAIGLARDIATHGLHGTGWQVIVTEADAVVLTVSHSDIRPRRMKPWLDLARRIATYEPRFRPHIFAWLLTALVFAAIVQAAVTTSVLRNKVQVTGPLHHE
jgi:hypothetical protein